MYMSDRQRVELLLLPMIAQSVILAGADNPESNIAKTAVEHFGKAIDECTSQVDKKKQNSLVRRALRLHESITKPYREAEARVDKVGLMLYNLLNWSIESGYLILHDNTPMSRGLDLLLPALEPSANIAKLDESARKAAIKMLKTLQNDGYFSGVTIQ